MKRIFSNETISDTFKLEDNNHHYLKNVLRADINEPLEIMTSGEMILARISDIQKRYTVVTVEKRRNLTPPPYSFTVFQCLLKREYMDTVVEKYAELGVTKVVPVTSAFSLHELKENSLRRFQEIAKAAALQSEQEFIMNVTDSINILNVAAINECDNLLFYERAADKSLINISKKTVQMIVGPEGGFSESEVVLLSDKGFKAVSPLSAILKAETAAVVFAGSVRMALEQLR